MLSKITAHNFLSWKELTFNVTKGATLVDGWNEDDQRSEGSGKSSVLNAISWGIYGQLPKDVNVDDVVKDGETSCAVVLEFDNGDAIVRSRKPNELYLLKSGATIKGKDARETQAFIEEYIGCNFETFCQSVYFAQNYDKKFLSSNQEAKGKILSSIQNLQVFDKARKEAMDLLKLENDKIVKIKNSISLEVNNYQNYVTTIQMNKSFIADKIKKHKEQVSFMTQQRDLVSGHAKRAKQEIEKINQQIAEIDLESINKDEQDLSTARGEFTTQLSGITYQKSQLDSIKANILSKENEGRGLATKYENLQTKLKTLVPGDTHFYRSVTVNKTSAIENAESSKNRLLEKIDQLENFIANPTKTCPSCGTELTNADTSHSEKEMRLLKVELSTVTKSLETQLSQFDKQLAEDISATESKIIEINKESEEIIIQLQIVSNFLDQNPLPSLDDLIAQEKAIKDTIQQIDLAIRETSQKRQTHSKLTIQLDNSKNQLNGWILQLNQFEESIKSLGKPDISKDEETLANLEKEQSIVKEKLDELNQLLSVSESYANQLESLKDGFKEIKSYVFTNALNELNYRTNQYLNELFEMEASIKFTNDDQKIESKIVIDGNERSLGLLSGGQNRRFNLAVDLALADIVSYRKTSKLDLLIFDEYFKDLSEISMEKSLNLLKDRKCPVILIEHNSVFKNIVDNTFFVRLQDGTSYESRP